MNFGDHSDVVVGVGPPTYRSLDRGALAKGRQGDYVLPRAEKKLPYELAYFSPARAGLVRF